VLWTGGRIDASLEKAKAKFSIRKSHLLIIKRDLAFNVIRSYSIWYSSYLKHKAFSESKQEHKALQKRIERRIEQGLPSGSDLSLINSRLLQLCASLNSTIVKLQGGLLQLEELVGESIDASLLVKNFLGDYMVDGVKKALLKQALEIDPKLKELLAKIKESRSTYKQVKSSLSPQLNLKLERQWGNYSSANADTKNRIFLELSSNFGVGLSIFSQIERAKLEEHSIFLDLEAKKSATMPPGLKFSLEEYF
jgi:adhesin transport system outer membrane protein